MANEGIKNIREARDPPAPAEVAGDSSVPAEVAEELQALIINVVDGKHGFYAVTVASFNGEEIYLTFSLQKEVLEEEISFAPEVLSQLPGTHVVLSNIIKKRKGWRALHARFLNLSEDGSLDEEAPSQSSQQRKEK